MSKLQVAVDAFALRHQIAETLLRFLHVVLHHQDGDSHWVELTDTPIRTRDASKENHATLTAEGTDGEALLRAVLLPTAFIRTDGSVAEPNPDERSGDDPRRQRPRPSRGLDQLRHPDVRPTEP